MAKISDKSIKDLKNIAARARQAMVESLIRAGCGHPGGAFSSIDAMVALYFAVMKTDPDNPKWEKRDRFILSKGHSSIGLYAVLHLKGFFGYETLLTFRQNDSLLAGHPDMHKVPGVEISTGSLGHGLSVGAGMAWAGKHDNAKYKTYVLMGDGETQEGSIWEAAMSASHYKLDNLIGLVDRNKMQIDGSTEEVMALEPYADKWRSFGWEVKAVDGHDMQGLVKMLLSAPFKKGKPSLIILNTIKGKGISFMENSREWHGKALTGKFCEMARKETCLKKY